MSRPARVFFALYLLVQLVVPALGLMYSQRNDRAAPFSWQMFSRLPADDG